MQIDEVMIQDKIDIIEMNMDFLNNYNNINENEFIKSFMINKKTKPQIMRLSGWI